MQSNKVINMLGIKRRINFRFILMLAVISLIEQLAFAAIHGVFFSYGNNYSSLHWHESLPAKEGAYHVSMDIEVEVAEEDDTHGSEDHTDCSLAT